MPVTVDEVRRIASLARLRPSPVRERELVSQLEAIVRFAGEMEMPAAPGPGAAFDLSGEGPVRAGEARDEPAPSLERSVVLSNAPDHRDDHVRLPALHPRETP